MADLPLTPELLQATYDFLRATPPFKWWRLPPGEEVTFKVMRKVWTRGDHWLKNGKHTIRVSEVNTGRTYALLMVMAHEMVHVVCDNNCVRSTHGAAFKKKAAKVCQYHGFDLKMF